MNKEISNQTAGYPPPMINLIGLIFKLVVALVITLFKRDKRLMSTVSHNHFHDLIVNNHVIKSFDVVPNSFLDMKKMIEINKIKVRLFNIHSKTIESDAIIDLEMENLVKDEAFLIVFGGWIPCTFIKRDSILLVDRNLVSSFCIVKFLAVPFAIPFVRSCGKYS